MRAESLTLRAAHRGSAGDALDAAPAAPLPAARRRLRAFAAWLLVVVGLGLLSFTRFWLDDLVNHTGRSALEPFVCEMTAMFGAGVLFLPLRAFVRRRPLVAGTLGGRLPLYLSVLLVLSAVHTSLNWASRSALYPLAGLGRYDYGAMPLRYAMEFPYDALAFAFAVAALHVLARLRQAREQALRAARLESSLARASLRSLRLQLQPHFLFNALHTVSATMYEDAAAADEMLDALAELLRASLRTVQTDEVPLDEELATLDRYLQLMRARFGDRLQVEVAVDPAVRGALVPSLLLQPLVENAVRHGGAELSGCGRVRVRAWGEEDELRVEVADDGPGCPAGRDPLATGLGLGATAERLQLLYGDRQHLQAGNVAAGGFLVSVRLPRRTGAAGDPPA
ncbi:MAG TPA: histidine kinase [Thermoanaerobaculia bacterium]|jgi:signal transduction histidine kinase|nr:histidine kinase [Thermoanaerobaculia bacterium]